MFLCPKVGRFRFFSLWGPCIDRRALLFVSHHLEAAGNELRLPVLMLKTRWPGVWGPGLLLSCFSSGFMSSDPWLRDLSTCSRADISWNPSFFVGNSILKLVEDCNRASLGGDFWSWQSDTLSLWGWFPAGLRKSEGCTPFPLYAFFLPSPGGHPFIAHSTQVSFWVLAWKYPNVTFWFRIPSTCMMKSLNFSLPHFLLKWIWRLSALTA